VRKLSLTLALCIAPLLCTPSMLWAEGGSGRAPSRIASADGPGSDPVWISAGSVVDRAGQLVKDTLPFGVKVFVERELRNGNDKKYGCFGWGPTVFDHAGPVIPHSTFKEMAQNSKSTLKGTVVAVFHGFSVLGPSALLEIRVDEWLKRSDEVADRPYTYVIYPVDEFESGGYRFCKKETSQWGITPAVGDEILLLPYRSPVDDAGQVFFPDPDDYEVILKRQGQDGLSVPKAIKDDPDVLGIKDLGALRNRAFEHIRQAKGSHPPVEENP
jgi:hypothetical protein